MEGKLAITRAVGDYELKTKAGYCTAKPDIFEISLDESIDSWIILACDGLYDVLSNEDVYYMLTQRLPILL